MGASTEVVVGIPIHYQHILDTFTRTWEAVPARVLVEEKSHLEDRFDPRTGAKLTPVKIIDAIKVTQPALMMTGIFFSMQEYQDFVAGPGTCAVCLEVLRTGAYCPDKSHRQAYGQHEVQRYDPDDLPPPPPYSISEELLNRLNGDGDEFVVHDDGYRGKFYHFSLSRLRSQTDDSFSALDVVDAMPALGRLRALLLEAGLTQVPAATITPVFHE